MTGFNGAYRKKREGRGGIAPALPRILVLVLGVVLIGPSAWSQTSPQKWEIFAEGGASFTPDHTIDSTQAGFGTIFNTVHIPTSGRLFIGFRYWFNDHEALEGSYSYTPTNIVVTSGCENVYCGESIIVSKARTSFFSANYVRSLRAHGLVRPFLTAGIGMLDINCLGPNPCLELDSFTMNLGGGIDIRLGRGWFLRVEDRDWLYEGIRQNDFYSGGGEGLTHNQASTIGFAYRF